MNYFKYKKTIAQIRKVSLDKNERLAMRNELMSKIDAERNLLISSNLVHPKRLIKVLLIYLTGAIVLIGAPLSYAAEKSVPGDFLYPVKVKINEKVKRVVDKTIHKDSTEFEINLLETKIREAEKIIERDNINITEKTKHDVQQSVILQVERALKSSEKTNEKDLQDKLEDKPVEIKKEAEKNVDLEVNKANKNILENLKESKDEVNKENKNDNNGNKQEVTEGKDNKKLQKKKTVDEVLQKNKDVLKKIDLPDQSKSYLKK